MTFDIPRPSSLNWKGEGLATCTRHVFHCAYKVTTCMTVYVLYPSDRGGKCIIRSCACQLIDVAVASYGSHIHNYSGVWWASGRISFFEVSSVHPDVR